MKINFLLPHLKIAGGVRIILSYANFLAERGHEVAVITTEHRTLRRWLKILKKEPNWFKPLQARVIYLPAWSEKYLPEADISVGDSWLVGKFLLSLPDKFGKKFQFIQHDERLYHGQPEQVSRVYSSPIPKIVVSTWLKEILKKDFKQEAELLLNPVDPKTFYPLPDLKKAGHVRVLMLNHSYLWKGVADGLEAYRAVKGRHPEIKLELVMFGVRGTKPGVCDEYHADPPQGKLAEIYSSCDIFLCPSWDEGFGLPALEAMNCGLALVIFDNGGSHDYAIDGQTALVAPRRDQLVLTQKLEQLVVDQTIRQKIAVAGLAFAHKLPSWEEQTGRLETLFKNAINS